MSGHSVSARWTRFGRQTDGIRRRIEAGFLAVALAGGLGGCASAPPAEEELPSAEVLYQRGLSHLESGGRILWFFPSSDNAKAIEAFQQIIDNYPYSDQAVLAELKIADAYFLDEKYDEALSYYRDFSELHPNHDQVPYTLLRAARCHYEQSRDSVRDQTATRAAVGFLDTLLSKHGASPQAVEGRSMWIELRTRLAEHELEIAEFYEDREEYQSAAERYQQVLARYPGLGLEADTLDRLGRCYQELHLEQQAKQTFELIARSRATADVAAGAADQVPSAQ